VTTAVALRRIYRELCIPVARQHGANGRNRGLPSLLRCARRLSIAGNIAAVSICSRLRTWIRGTVDV
jgi:hypothetical protein